MKDCDGAYLYGDLDCGPRRRHSRRRTSGTSRTKIPWNERVPGILKVMVAFVALLGLVVVDGVWGGGLLGYSRRRGEGDFEEEMEVFDWDQVG